MANNRKITTFGGAKIQHPTNIVLTRWEIRKMFCRGFAKVSTLTDTEVVDLCAHSAAKKFVVARDIRPHGATPYYFLVPCFL